MGVVYRARGKKIGRDGKRSWQLDIHDGSGQRERKTIRATEQDVKALCQAIRKEELAGRNVVEAYRTAKAAPAPVTATCARLQDELPPWIAGQVRAREIRASTAKAYRTRCATWLYPHALADGQRLGDVPVNLVTREMLGGVIRRVREAGRSMAVVEQIRNPVRGYFQSLIETKILPGPNPAADLKYFVGKHGARRPNGYAYFTLDESPTLMAAVAARFPKWHAFILSGLLAGLRWGESAGLYKSAIDGRRGRIHVQRTVSEGGRLEAPKDHDGRWVKASPALLHALEAQIETATLEGQMKAWTPEQRKLLFPNVEGHVVSYAHFLESVWQPLLDAAKLPYRKYHSTRHSYATWLLENGTDLRWVQRQLGHAS